MVTVAVFELPFDVAVITTDSLAVTVPAIATNNPVIAPAATFTDDGAVSAVLLSVSAIVVPLIPAGAESVTVQVELAPDAIDAGVQSKLVTVVVSGVTVSVMNFELLFSDAVMVTD